MCRVQTKNRMTEAMEERERKYEEKEGKGRRKKKKKKNKMKGIVRVCGCAERK